MKVLISDNLSPRGVEILKTAGLEVDFRSKTPAEEIEKIIGDYDALIIRSATKVTAALLEKATRLKVIGRAGSGLDNVDIPAATKKGVVVMNTPGGNTVTTAEHTIGMLFACARMIPQAYASMKAGKWEKKKFEGVELCGQDARRRRPRRDRRRGRQPLRGARHEGPRLRPLHLDRRRPRRSASRLADLPTIWQRADFITVHTPKTKETANLINTRDDRPDEGRRAHHQLRPRRHRQRAGPLRGARERQGRRRGLRRLREGAAGRITRSSTLDNFIATPHLGASTQEAQENVATAVAEQVVDYLVGGTVRNAVNVPSVPADQLPTLSPYINLAERIGLFQAQLFEGGLTEVLVEYSGEVASLKLEPITLAALKGLLTPILEENVNYVNAPLIAKDRGIEVKVSTSSAAAEYTSLITIRVTAGGRELSVAGTLNSSKEPRIVQVDNFPMEAVPEGDMLVLMNNDKPGRHRRDRHADGRERHQHRAHAVRPGDGRRPRDVRREHRQPRVGGLMAKIRKLPNVLSVKLVKV